MKRYGHKNPKDASPDDFTGIRELCNQMGLSPWDTLIGQTCIVVRNWSKDGQMCHEVQISKIIHVRFIEGINYDPEEDARDLYLVLGRVSGLAVGSIVCSVNGSFSYNDSNDVDLEDDEYHFYLSDA